MIATEYLVSSKDGLHARPATNLIRLAKKYKSGIILKKEEKSVMLNSMLNLLSMSIKAGDTITINIEGEDEAEAFAALDSFFKEELKHL
jgi:phosphocarrier protein HPr